MLTLQLAMVKLLNGSDAVIEILWTYQFDVMQVNGSRPQMRLILRPRRRRHNPVRTRRCIRPGALTGQSMNHPNRWTSDDTSLRRWNSLALKDYDHRCQNDRVLSGLQDICASFCRRSPRCSRNSCRLSWLRLRVAVTSFPAIVLDRKWFCRNWMRK